MENATGVTFRTPIARALLLCGALIGCQGQASSALDPEEKQWVSEERIIPPTGGPVIAAPAPAMLARLAEPVSAVARPSTVASAPAPVAVPQTPSRAPEKPAPPASAPAPKHGSFPQSSVAEQVRVSMYPSTIITCDGPLEVDYEHSKATFHDNVHVTDERGELFADVMEVFFTPAHEIDQVVSTGNVRIVRGDDTAYCDRAVYLQKEGRVLMTGQPKLVLLPETKEQIIPSKKTPKTQHERTSP